MAEDADPLEAIFRRVISENQQARETSSRRLSRLVDATIEGNHDEFKSVLDELAPRSGGTSQEEVEA